MRRAGLALLALLGCEAPPQVIVLPAREAGAADATPTDMRPLDPGVDAALDLAPVDAEPADAGPVDAQPLDADRPDVQLPDAELPDADPPDADPLACSPADPAVGQPCQGFVGRCTARGTLICAAGQLWCDLVPPAARAEVCNGADDDCDGAIDEAEDAPCGPGAECAAQACRCAVGRADADGQVDNGCELGCADTVARAGPAAAVVPEGGLAGDAALVFVDADGLWALTDDADQPALVRPLPAGFSPLQVLAAPGPRPLVVGVVGGAAGTPAALWLADPAGGRVQIMGPQGRPVAAAAALITPADELVVALRLADGPEVVVHRQPWGAPPGEPALWLQVGGRPALAWDGAVQVAVVGAEQTAWVADLDAPQPLILQGMGAEPVAARIADGALYAVGMEAEVVARWARWAIGPQGLGERQAGRLDLRAATGLMAGPLGVAALGQGRDDLGTRMPAAQWFGRWGPGAPRPVVDGANAVVFRARRFGSAMDRVAWIELEGAPRVRWARAPCR